ncbi:MAG: KpsF/GutQ family sugar-phosphate isomerase [Marinicaulis sp.]|nr:KpsF/GutQ family sugar-phosphate isomerase [Marinicaulis sp.]
MPDHLDIAKEVIELEISGLKALKKAINTEFDSFLSILRQTTGRIVVTGMGKSGHVARKIAATFSSTGSPSVFVHPGEASHGDLGMISAKDVILALSKSGETSELGDLLAYAARFEIPVLAITSKSNSTLAKAASATLTMPNAKEACGETRAPTTSTTMMMVAGDALAIALLRDRGFTAKDFHGFHPGGNLGAALRRVSDLMHGADSVPVSPRDASMTDIVKAISDGGFGCVGIVDGQGRLEGVITDGDLRRHFGDDHGNIKAADIMTSPARSTHADALAGDILALMSREKITALFVVDNERPIGIVHVHDCLSTGVL